MSMPGYREQYPEQDDIDERRDYDDWMEGEMQSEYERFLDEQEQRVRRMSVSWLRWFRGGKLIEYEWVEAPIRDAAGITLDEFILDLIIMDDDWD